MVSFTVQARAWCLEEYRFHREQGCTPSQAMTEALTTARRPGHNRSALGEFRIFYAERYLKIIAQRALHSPCWGLGWENS